MSDRLTPERRAEIEQDYDDGYEKLYKCIPELLAEIDALQADLAKNESECIQAMDGQSKHTHAAIKRAEAERDKLCEVVQDFNVEECEGCFGTGHDGGDTKNNDDCTYCAGYGEIITGGDPTALQAAQDSINARS
jgi:hypothetical protein